MPELPDVEVFRRYLAATALHKQIRSVHVAGPALLKDTTPQALGRALKDAAFESTLRHGKYLFAGTDRRTSLVLHFGMSGSSSLRGRRISAAQRYEYLRMTLPAAGVIP